MLNSRDCSFDISTDVHYCYREVRCDGSAAVCLYAKIHLH
jgi:hypothetical protein